MTAMHNRVSFRQYGLPPVSLDFSWRHVSVVLLSFDELNPVKVLCSYTSWFMGFSEVHLGIFASLLLLALGINQRDHILYNCARTVLFARKSYDRPFVGFLARAFHCIPVARPQDMAYTGQGTIKLEQGSAKVQGIDTHFSVEVPPGSQINVQGHEKLLKVKEVHGNTELTVDVPATCSASAAFKVHPKVDQSAMYGQVYKNLCSGNCLGIFPEGGSHDRTDLLPLKAGVAVIALEALRLHHINVPIVPVGLNYFRGHQFGGRVVMEFGAPLMISEEVHAMYETNRREATEEVLDQVAAAMRSVIVPTEDYKTLQQIFMVRRLWVKEGLKLSPSKAMDLNRRFAVGVNRILRLADRASGGAGNITSNELASQDLPAENQEPLSKQELQAFQELRTELEEYMTTLKKLGIRDHQVPQLVWWTAGDLIGRFMYLLVSMAMGVLPQLMFNVPLMLLASRFASVEQQKSLKSSSVKLAARDVVMSYKVIYVLTFIPVLYVIYGMLLWVFTDWCLTSRILILHLGKVCRAVVLGGAAEAKVEPAFVCVLGHEGLHPEVDVSQFTETETSLVGL
ncbi:SCT1 [Symbiodinium sp. CCMP2592]|nr:SCT1 [Symbiodinium sp. CCMP2592]